MGERPHVPILAQLKRIQRDTHSSSSLSTLPKAIRPDGPASRSGRLSPTVYVDGSNELFMQFDLEPGLNFWRRGGLQCPRACQTSGVSKRMRDICGHRVIVMIVKIVFGRKGSIG